MKRNNISETIGNINTKYIDEATEYTGVAKITPKKVWYKWVAAAACFAVAIMIAIPFISNPVIDNLGEYKAHIFSSYDEFNTVVPDVQIIENLANMEGINVTIYGTFVDVSIEDSSKVENYAWFDVEAKRGEEFVATVQLKLNDKDSVAVYVKNHSLVNETTIGGVQVFYAYNADMEYWDSVLEFEGNYYNIHSYSADKQSFIEFLTLILDNEEQI